MVVFAGDCTCRFFYGHILAFGMSAELFGEETYLYLCKAVFSSQHSAWFINRFACVLRANRIVTEVVSKRWHNLIYILSSAIFSAQLQISVAYFCSIGLYFLV